MKSLKEHIVEKLVINKDYDSDNFADVGIFNDVSELYVITFDKNNGVEMFFNIFKLKNYQINRDGSNTIFYINSAGSLFDDLTIHNMPAIYNEESDIIYYENDKILYLMISENDKERLKLLLQFMKSLKNKSNYLLSNICNQLNIERKHNTKGIYGFFLWSHNQEYRKTKAYLKQNI